MGDLSFLPQVSATVTAIYKRLEQQGQERDGANPRNYLGASVIGHECARFLWYTFRQCYHEKFDGRMLRLFDTGHREEARFIEELRGIGCEVHDRDPETPSGQIGVSAIGGHFKGHLDAMALGIPEAPKRWHVCEFKTFNDNQFGKLKKTGVKVDKPRHYAQMQVYMGLTNIDRALYLAVNKDTDELYSERVHFDPVFFKNIMLRAEQVIKHGQPPQRVTVRADDWRCKYCAAADLCWGTGEVAVPLPAKSCRHCCHATVRLDGDGGLWSCDRQALMKPCAAHLLIPGLIAFADDIDASDGEDPGEWIKFENRTGGATWLLGNGADGTWSTDELMRTPAAMVGEKTVDMVKKVFGGKVVEAHLEPDGACLWDGTIDQEAEIVAKLRECLGLADGVDLPDPTDTVEDEEHRVFDYGGRFVLIIYKTGKTAINEKLPF